MEVRLLDSELLGKCGILWSNVELEIEAFHLHLVATTYGDAASGSSRTELWLAKITMVRVIWIDILKIHVLVETSYGLESPNSMVVKYL